MSINKIAAQAILDTGATVSVISENSVPENVTINPEGFQGVLQGVNSNTTVAGTVKLNINITSEVVLHHEFVVVKNILPSNLILGTDFLNRIQAVINFPDKNLNGTYGGKNFYLALFAGANDNKTGASTYHAHSKGLTPLLANTAAIYAAKTKAPDGFYLTSKNRLYPNCYVPEAVVKVRNKIMSICIINSNDKIVYIKDNSIVCNLDPVSENIYNINSCPESENLDPISLDFVPNLKGKAGADNLIQLLNEFRETISVKGERLGSSSLTKLQIDTGDSEPLFTKQFSLPHKHKEIIKELCQEMAEKNIIRPSVSPWNSPLFLVKKANGEFRPVVDFRKINKITKTDPFPLPKIDEIYQQLNGSTLFSTLDLNSGYFQMKLSEEDIPKTAFTTNENRFEFIRVPFGVKNAPAAFSRLMNIAMSDLLGSDCLVYLDDILIFSKTLESHLEKLKKVLKRLKEVGLTLKLSKCRFLEPKLKFLGHEVSENGISINTDQFLPVENFPIPKNRKDIQKFLGLTSYFRNFVPKFAEICEPVTKLLKKKEKFIWTVEAQDAFTKIKREILNSGKLCFPDLSEPFIIQTDSSARALGACLAQEKNKILRPIFFASRGLSQTEQKYSTTKRELLAIRFALRKFRTLILGYKTTVFTDHQPLVGMFKMAMPENTFSRWILEALEFDVEIKYLPGKLNIVSDSLSRLESQQLEEIGNETEDNINDYLGTIACRQVFTWDKNQLILEQEKDKKLGPIVECLTSKSVTARGNKITNFPNYVLYNGVLFVRVTNSRSGIQEVKLLICVPASMEATIIKNVHTSLAVGHAGVERTIAKLNSRFSINGIYGKVKEIVRTCDTCTYSKGIKHKDVQINKYPIPSQAFVKVHMDFYGPLKTTTRGSKYILAFTDFLTRFLVLYDLPDRSTHGVAKTIKHFIATYDVPQTLVSDRAAEFQSALIKKVCAEAGINKVEVFPRTGFSNGVIERKNAQIGALLRAFCGSDMYYTVDNDITPLTDWDLFLPNIQAAINSTFNRSLGDTPFYCLYHFDRRDVFTDDIEVPSDEQDTYDIWEQLEERDRIIYKNIKAKLAESVDDYTEKTNKNRKIRDLAINQRVFISRPGKVGECSKLAPKWTGPAHIVEKINNCKYKVKLVGKNKYYDVHVNNIYSRNEQLEDPEVFQNNVQIEQRVAKNTHAMNTRSKSAFNS